MEVGWLCGQMFTESFGLDVFYFCHEPTFYRLRCANRIGPDLRSFVSEMQRTECSIRESMKSKYNI